MLLQRFGGGRGRVWQTLEGATGLTLARRGTTFLTFGFVRPFFPFTSIQMAGSYSVGTKFSEAVLSQEELEALTEISHGVQCRS